MSVVLLAGVGPLPCEDAQRHLAPGLRVSLFGEALARAGHRVELALTGFGESSSSLRHWRIESSDSPRPEFVGERAGEPSKVLGELAGEFHPSAAVATTDAMASAAASAGLGCPLWVDFYGSPMVERQQQAALADHDGGLAAAWRTILPALLSADRFSTCSNPQKLALVGELGACGRLNRQTAGVDMVFSIPPAAPFDGLEAGERAIRGILASEDGFIVLWSGGYNTWTDVDTLHEGLVRAMTRSKKVHFVSTGGAIPGQCEDVYPHFQSLIKKGPHSDRFHLLGWVEPDMVRCAWREADLAINIDRFTQEGLLGTRTRLLDWIAAGLPLATTVLCELSEILRDRELALTFRIGDADALADLIVNAQADSEALKAMAKRAAEAARTEWAPDRLFEPLLEWIANPVPAPDLPPPVERPNVFVNPVNTLAQAQRSTLLESKTIEEFERLRRENAQLDQRLRRLEGSRAVRWFMRLKGWDRETP